ncbi:MAG: DNA repair protein RadC [Candidatus Aenigmarchaeota archaeon]|nr:DNA repair protein RadC [Candidatus Aenigmarchaeota archaeon]
MRQESSFRAGTYRGYHVSTRLVRTGGRRYEPFPVRDADDVYSFLRELERYDREVFYALHLDTKNQLIGCEEVSKGCLSWSVVHPREVYKGAILNSAGAVIVAHNHPSGDPTPSPQDRDVVQRLYSVGELLGIPLLDSVVIGDGRYTSMRREGGAFAKAPNPVREALQPYGQQPDRAENA